MKEKMPKKGGRWWFSWRSRTTSVRTGVTVVKYVESEEREGGERV